MTEEDWANPGTRAFGLRLAGDAIDEVDERGEPIVDDTFLILINGHCEPLPFVLPAHQSGVRWEPVLDTREAEIPRRGASCAAARPTSSKRARWRCSVRRSVRLDRSASRRAILALQRHRYRGPCAPA